MSTVLRDLYIEGVLFKRSVILSGARQLGMIDIVTSPGVITERSISKR